MAARSFVRNPGALPESLFVTTDERAVMLRRLGQTEEQAAISVRQALAGEYFTSVDSLTVDALREVFTSREALVDSPRLPEVSDETLGVLDKAQQGEGKRLFDSVELWTNAHEFLVVCIIRIASNQYAYYLVDQWGDNLTDVEELVKKQRKQQARNRRMNSASDASAVVAGIVSLVLVVTVLFGATAWLLLPAVVAGIGAYALGFTFKVGGANAILVVGSTVAATVLTVVFGLNAFIAAETDDRYTDVLVCSVGERPDIKDNQLKGDKWIGSPQGDFNIQAGTYGGRFYTDLDEAAEAIKVGKSYRLKHHGNIGRKNYATGAELLAKSLGQCGK